MGQEDIKEEYELAGEGDLKVDSELAQSYREVLEMQWLAEAHVRASEPRGGEVRTYLFVVRRPRAEHRVSVDTRRWTWRHVVPTKLKRRQRGFHINLL